MRDKTKRLHARPISYKLSRLLSPVDCKTVGFFLKISKEMGKAWRKSLTRAKRASLTLSVFSFVADLLFDCSRVLEYAKIRTVLQSSLRLLSRKGVKEALRNKTKNCRTELTCRGKTIQNLDTVIIRVCY